MNKLNYKKALLIMFLGVLLIYNTNAQDNVGIGTTTPNASAILELSATDKGFLVPRLTTAQRNAIGTPATGLVIFNTESGTFEYYSGSSWIQLFSGSFLSLTNGRIFVGNASNQATAVILGGDASIDNTGVLTISNNAITNAKVSSTAEIEVSKLENSSTDQQIIRTSGATVEWWTPNFLTTETVGTGTSAGGDLTGTYPNPTITNNAITNAKVSSTAEIEVSKLENSSTDQQIIRTSGATVEWWTPNFLTTETVGTGTSAGGDLTGTYPNPTIATNAVTTTKILDANVTTAKIADNNVDGTKINILDNANGDLMYYNGTDWVRLAPGTSGYMLQTNGAGNAPTWVASSLTLENGEIFVGNASSVPTSVPMTGDASIDNTGLLTIANGAVTDAKLGTGINANKIANGTVDNTEFQYLNGVSSNIQTQLTGKLTKSLQAGYVFVGNSSGDAQERQITGDISMSATGSASIQNNAITDIKISPAASIDVNKLNQGPSTGDLLRTNGFNVEWWTPNFLTTETVGTGTSAGGDLTGTYPNPTVDALQGKAVSSTAPTNGQVLTWNNTLTQWEPQSPGGSSGWALTGNSLTGTEILGSTNAQPLVLVTSNTERMRIWDDGQIGINYATSFDDSIKVWLDGDMLIDGDLIVTGTIDPIALQLIPQASAPVSATSAGFMYYNSTSQTIKVTNGTTWSDLGSNLTNGLDLKNTDDAAKELKFYEPSNSGSEYTAFKAQAQGGNVTYTLPAADGTNGQVLTTDGSGGLSWQAPSSPSMSVTTLSSATTLNSSHELVLCSGSDFTITLPSAVGLTGKVYTFKAIINSSNYSYTIQPVSGQTIDTTSPKVFKSGTTGGIVNGYQIVSDGSNWHIISKIVY